MLPLPRIRFLVILLGSVALTAYGILEGGLHSTGDDPKTDPVAKASATPAASPSPSSSAEAPRPALNPPTLSPELPADVVSLAKDPASAASSDAIDVFAWKTFVALHWPADTDGTPNPAQPPGLNGDNPGAWETWSEPASLFSADGGAPASRGSASDASARPVALRDLPPDARIFVRTGTHLAALLPEATEGPLVDQNGRHIRIEARMNRPAFETLTAYQLRRLDAVGAPPEALRFPEGAIRIQAAWKVLSPAEIAAGRFHAVRAFLYTPPASPAGGPGVVEHATMGLVGLHIVRKTPSAPGWIWASFEHVDNCPDAGRPADRAAYNFYDKTSPSAPLNRPPSPPWDATAIEPGPRRSQIARTISIPAGTRAINAAYQAALRAINPASPWQYYQLIGTQRGPDAGDAPVARFAPLANTTLEAYLAASGARSASCVACHGKASAVSGASADSFFLSHPAP